MTGCRDVSFYCGEALSGRTPVAVVAVTHGVLAFRHTHQYWPEHVVVIPKRQAPSLLASEPTDPLLAARLGVVQRVAADIQAHYGACRAVTNLGTYQDSKHLHWHVSAGEPLF